MRTTVDIPDAAYRRLKAAAALEGCTVKDMILRMVERELSGGSPGFRVQLPLIRSDQPGTVQLTNEIVNDILSP